MPTQTQVDNFLDELRTKQSEATTTFGADSTELDVKPTGDVQLTIRFTPDDSDGSGDISPSEVKAAEQSAVDTASELRGYGPDQVQLHSDGTTARVIAVFR